jgi:nitrogen regulatory protein P-II 2
MAVKIHCKKVTIIAERVLKDQVIAILKKLGAKGWTMTEVTGEGSRGIRASEWEGSNVQIDTLVNDAIADAIMDEIATKYFEDWSIVVYALDVEVLRAEKY